MYADVIIDISHEQLDKTFQYAVPDELVDVILFMCSENASFITGSNHVVDGGRLCMYQKTY